MNRLVFLLIAAMSLAAHAAVQPVFQQSWSAGVTDTNGNLLYGTETMFLTPYNGKLYAGTSAWMETNAAQTSCKLFVLDSPGAAWRQVHKFAPANLRLTCLRTVTFTTDGAGNPVAPVTMLLAAPDRTSAGTMQVFSLNDTTSNLVAMAIGPVTNYSSTRAIGFHHDSVTGVDLVFAGNDDLGLVTGGYNPSATGRIQWQTNASELPVPIFERVMAFAEVSGSLYCATTKSIYQRTDGPAPAWQSVYYSPKETNAVGLRGLTAVPNPSGTGQVLLFIAQNAVRHIDPAAGNQETVEQDLAVLLSQSWGHKVGFVLAAYNNFLACTNPATGEAVHLFGFESTIKLADLQANPQLRIFQSPGGNYLPDARFFIRHAGTNGISFELRQIPDPSLPTRVSTRTIGVSPFASDQGNVLYFGGFDCNSQPSHNTVWIYRGSNVFGAILNDDSATTAQATPVDIDVLSNDPGAYSLQSVGPAERGTTSIVAGKVRYTPNANFLGTDTFTYQATNGVHSASANVSVSVNAFDGSYRFPLNQSTGLTTFAADGTHTANLNNFTNNPTQWIAGRLGSDHALEFDGTTNYVSVDSFTGILGAGDRTCAAWVQTTASGTNFPVVSWGPNTSGNKWQLNMNTAGRMRVEISSGSVVGTTIINNGNWHHVACTFTNNGTSNASNILLYVDGVLEALTAVTPLALNTTASGNVKIGADNQNRFWNGAIVDVRIYNRGLSSNEIAALATDAGTISALDWNSRYFPGAATNWTADDDGDGFKRLHEYALGGQPLINEATLLGSPVVVSNHYRWSIPQRRPVTTTATYAVECTSDLVNWNVPVNFLGTSPLNADFETAWYEATAPVSGATNLFLRVRVSLP